MKGKTMQLEPFNRVENSQEKSVEIITFFSEENLVVYEILHGTKTGRSFLKVEKNSNFYTEVKNIKTNLLPTEQLKVALEQINNR